MLTIEQLKVELPPLCQQYGIGKVDVFGSVARQEARDDSDLDLLIELSKESNLPANEQFFGFQFALEDKYKRDVDLLTESSLENPFLKRQIERDKIHLYG